MHSAVLHLAPVLAAEKSKVPFFIAGGLLALWAMVLSIGLGLRHAQFPGNLGGQRGVIAITLVLVLAATSTAVITSGPPAKTGEASAAGAAPSAGGTTPTTPAAPSGEHAGEHRGATTGTPPPASSPAPNKAGSSLKLAASPGGQLSYDTRQLSAKAGSVTITFTNGSPLEHNVTIAQGSTVLGATPSFIGGSRTLTVALKPGTYTFYCSVPGHRAAGMEGTLSVS